MVQCTILCKRKTLAWTTFFAYSAISMGCGSMDNLAQPVQMPPCHENRATWENSKPDMSSKHWPRRTSRIIFSPSNPAAKRCHSPAIERSAGSSTPPRCSGEEYSIELPRVAIRQNGSLPWAINSSLFSTSCCTFAAFCVGAGLADNGVSASASEVPAGWHAPQRSASAAMRASFFIGGNISRSAAGDTCPATLYVQRNMNCCENRRTR